MSEYRYQLMGYGPYSIPERARWLIVGSGPSSPLRKKFIAENPECGVIALNCTIHALDNADILILSHYENFIGTVDCFPKANLVFLPDPVHAGFRCQPIDAVNAFDYDYFEKEHPWRVRFFKKSDDMDGALFCQHTIATAALHLLALNGVRNVHYCGIDGGLGHSEDLAAAYGSMERALGSRMPDDYYDRAKEEFLRTARHLKVTTMNLSEGLVHA